MTRAARERVCGRLGQAERMGRPDFCGLPQGHEGPHEGKYRGLVWEEGPKRGRINVIRSGDPIHNIPAQPDEKAWKAPGGG